MNPFFLLSASFLEHRSSKTGRTALNSSRVVTQGVMPAISVGRDLFSSLRGTIERVVFPIMAASISSMVVIPTTRSEA